MFCRYDRLDVLVLVQQLLVRQIFVILSTVKLRGCSRQVYDAGFM